MSHSTTTPRAMGPAPRSGAAARGAAVVLLLVGAVTVAGCFYDKLNTEDRWTRVDFGNTSVTPGQIVPGGSPQAFSLRANVTYRDILTGFCVAELRVADSLGAAQMTVAPDAPRVPMAQNIDVILQNSRSLGRSTRAVTGWDHLIQPIDFAFSATPPSGSTGRLFLLCYLGSGTRVEFANGGDTLIITPFISSQREVLPVGMELVAGP